MLLTSLIIYSIWITADKSINSIHYNRISKIILAICITLGFIIYDQNLYMYHTLFSYSIANYLIDNLLYFVGITLLYFNNFRKEYTFLVIFIILGSSIIMSSNDLISIYLNLELQSFGLYIITCIYNNIGSTRASLKYFLLGAISSAFILLGISIIYNTCGTTNFQELSNVIQLINKDSYNFSIIIGITSILCGFIFKVSAAPFHNWAPDVYDSVPTNITVSLITLPKIGLIFFICQFIINISTPQISQFILIIAIISLIIGTVQGINQTFIKRLLTYSTISHVGFILIGISITANGLQEEQGLSAFLFYIIQYIVTTLLTFIVVNLYEKMYIRSNITLITDFLKISQHYKILAFTIILCFFSIAGIPPLIGFYAKIEVLRSITTENSSIVFIIAIIASVISASYYIKLIKIMIFHKKNFREYVIYFPSYNDIDKGYAYLISFFIFVIVIFILDPSLLLNSTEIAALTYLQM